MSMSDFEREFLEAHNHYRALHGVPPLKLSREICNYATEWAQHIAAKNVMQHRTNNRYGENIFWASGQNVTGKDAVRSWYDEEKYYNYNNSTYSSQTGHFTAVVWKSSTEVGVGVAKRGSSTYVVANYSPPGNMLGNFKQNVLPKIR